MAGYLSKLQSYLYEGELVNGASNPVPNGVLMIHSNGKLVLPGAADTDSVFVCKEVGTIYDGRVAYRFIVDALSKRYYFVENGADINDSAAYDKAEYVTKVGDELRAHPLLVGDEFWTDQVTGTPVANSTYGVKADGTIG